MDIAAMSVSLASSRLGLAVGTSVTKKAMESAEINAEGLSKMIEAAKQIMPDEHIIDVRA